MVQFIMDCSHEKIQRFLTLPLRWQYIFEPITRQWCYNLHVKKCNLLKQLMTQWIFFLLFLPTMSWVFYELLPTLWLCMLMGLCARSILSHQFCHTNFVTLIYVLPILTHQLWHYFSCCSAVICSLDCFCILRLWNSLQSTYYRHRLLWSALMWKLSGSWLHHDGNLPLNLSQDGVSVLLEGDLCNLIMQLKRDTMYSANFWLFCQLCLESFKWTLCQIYDFICQWDSATVLIMTRWLQLPIL